MNMVCMMHMNAYYSYLKNYTPILMMTVFSKNDKLESTLCNDCGHTANNDGVCTDQSLHIDETSNVQTNNNQLINLMRELL